MRDTYTIMSHHHNPELKKVHIPRGGLLGHHGLSAFSFHLIGPENVVIGSVLELGERG